MSQNTPLTAPHPVEALILARVDASLQQRLKAIRLMVFDVDGVLTDGRLWYGEHGEALKAFHALDGLGLRLLKENGVHVALVTGRQGAIVARRAADLGIAEVHQGISDKLPVIQEIATKMGLNLSEIGYMGDDIIDLMAMQRVGFAASVPNAPPYISQVAHWVAAQAGGSGAVRECCDLILAAQGKLGACLQPRTFNTAGSIQ
jgi:3-deoxy-D-manno-octulosonate 8-phosphate phosphatase (KDO 8-P phosphatase)